ncbi:hypothetical protein RB653_006237 [Dictyostelium firmibasis]|uniref:Uncharacterized protein n=1 Tax=Dictyostelium firmibasis TaxID=79012 RepID=A0AAN7UD35_9MYCE
MKLENKEIAIVGLGFRIPQGKDSTNNGSVSHLWNNLKDGFNGIVETSERWSDNINLLGEINNKVGGLLPLKEWSDFDPVHFAINPSEVPLMDPQTRVLLKCTWEALEDAFIDPIDIRGSNTSCFIGCSTLDYSTTTRNFNETSENYFASNVLHTISNRVSFSYDIRGPSMTIDTACSSSLNSIAMGYQSIQNGTSNLSIVGGASLLLDPYISKSFSFLNMLSKNGKCKPFDSEADGYIRGESCGVVILKPLSDAIRDGNNIYCIVKSFSSNVDGGGLHDKSNFYSPSKQSQSDNIKLALKYANMKASDISFVECHGTGTPTGDPIEVEGVSMALDSSSLSTPLLIGSFKSNIGHSEAASGVASLIKCCLMFKNKHYAPNVNFDNPNPKINFKDWNIKVVTEAIPFTNDNNKPVSMVINNFGVTGSNCCSILSQYIDQSNDNVDNIDHTTESQQTRYLIPFSANSVKSLESYEKLIINDKNLSTNSFKEFVKNQVYSKSKKLYQRSVLASSNWTELKNKSKYYKTNNDKSSNISIKRNKPLVAIVFGGQGSQWNKMAQHLYEHEPVFRTSMDRFNNELSKYYGYSVLDKLRSIKDDDIISIHQPIIAQPSILMLQISLFELYKHWGINASFIIGHSLGEIATSYCSGMVDFENVCKLIYHRSLSQNNTNGCGKMLSVNISHSEFIELYSNEYPSIEVACYNSPTSIVIAGNETLLKDISVDLKEKNIFCAFLGSLSSFHTSSQHQTKNEIIPLEILSKQSIIPTFSTVTTKLFDHETTPFNSSYVYENIIQPVRFSQTISNLYEHIENNKLGNEVIFIEVSPHPSLSFYLKQMIPKSSTYFNSVSVLTSTNKKNSNDLEEIHSTISQIYCLGYDVNFKCQFNQIEDIKSIINNTISLPNYQFDEQYYWKVDSHFDQYRSNGPNVFENLGNSMSIYSANTKSHQSIIDVNRDPFKYLKDHIVKGKYYFPGIGYADNLMKLYPNQDIVINNLDFLAPFVLKEGVKHILQTNVYQLGNSDYRVTFNVKDNKTNQWVQTCTGNFQLIPLKDNDNASTSKQDISQLLSTCNLTTLFKEEVYKYIKLRSGITHLGTFRGIEELHFGTDYIVTKIPINYENLDVNGKTIHQTYDKSFFNTALLDNCAQTIIGFITDSSQFVFERLEGLKVYSNNIPIDKLKYNNIYCVGKFISLESDSYKSSVLVLLEDGTQLLEIDCISFHSTIPLIDELLINNPTNELFTTYLQSKDSLINIESSNDDNVDEASSVSVLETIKQIINPIISEKTVFRVLQPFSDSELSQQIIETLNQISNENQLQEIDIEFTIIDDSNVEYPTLQDSSLIIKNDLNQLKPSYYDIVLSSTNNNETIKQLFNNLSNNGLLLIIGKDCNEYNINSLIDIGFNENKIQKSNKVIQAQKHSILSNELTLTPTNSNDNIIIYCEKDSKSSIEFMKLISNNHSGNQIIISNINEFKQELSLITNDSIIYSIKSIEKLELTNFKQITMDYIEINQQLLKNNLQCKHVLVSTDSQTKNFLSSSVIGAARYFDEFPNLNLYSIDFDNQLSLSSLLNIIINQLIENSSYHTQREYFVKNNSIYYERLKNEKNIKSNFKSNSFEDKDFMTLLDSTNLEYKLASKPKKLKSNEIEVKVLATGINYKDYLIYRGLITIEEIVSISKNPLGLEFSGIVTRVSDENKNCEFKVGDKVFGISYDATASHVITDVLYVSHKPDNISHVEAASLPIIFSTCLHSIFNIGNFNIDDGETILIHSATGGVGLAALEILKWKGHKSPVFVTVGSKEKEQYLIDNYGSLITGIYSSRNKDYVNEIKTKLNQIYGTSGKENGVDLVLNTLPNEFTHSNFLCLKERGKIIDLSITHLNSNEYLNFKKFKYNKSYHNIELMYISKKVISRILKSVSKALAENKLKPIPITTYKIEDVKEAIEYINQRKHIGKIVLDHSSTHNSIGSDGLLNKLIESNKNEKNHTILKYGYNVDIKNTIGKNIIITGQSGIILEILKWLIKFSPSEPTESFENIIILSKSSLKWELELLINTTLSRKNNNTKFHFKSLDIGDSVEVRKSINQILSENPSIDNIDSIFHYAFTQVTKEVEEIDIESLDISHNAKTMGAINLHEISIEKSWKLKQFVMASSIASLFGSFNQCSYVSANLVLDSLSRYRKSVGLPSTCTNWGSIKSAGFVSRNELVSRMLDDQGFIPIPTNIILGSLDLQLQNSNKYSNLIVAKFNYDAVKKFSSETSTFQRLDFILNSIKEKDSNNINSENNVSESTQTKILNKISELLSIEESKINTDIRLNDYGADSLTSVQLKNFIDKDIKSNSITLQQLQNNTIGTNIQIILEQIKISPNPKNNNNKKDSPPSLEFWKNEIKLDDSIQAIKENPIDFKNNSKVLLTGATGFLGVHLLSNLIKSSNCSVVYCLVRNKKSDSDPMNAIINNLKHHKLHHLHTEFELSKVKVIVGNLALPLLGLSKLEFDFISNQINLIINSGADINLSSVYAESKVVNIDGLIELIKLSTTGDYQKPIVTFSSVSVFFDMPNCKEFDEDTIIPPLENINNLPGGYMKSKVVGENILREAAKRGIPSMVIRPPIIFAHENTGIGHDSDFIQLIIQSCYAIKKYPRIEKNIITSPIGWVSLNTTKMIGNEKCWEKSLSNQLNVFSLNSDVSSMNSSFSFLEKEYACEMVEYEDWKKTVNESKVLSCIKLKTFHSLDGLYNYYNLGDGYGVSKKTKELLQSMNSFEGGMVNEKIIKNHINYIFKKNK